MSASDISAWHLAAILLLFPLALSYRFSGTWNFGLYPAIPLIFIILGFSRIPLRRIYLWYAGAVSFGTLIIILFRNIFSLRYDFWGPDDLIGGALFLFGARWLTGSGFESSQDQLRQGTTQIPLGDVPATTSRWEMTLTTRDMMWVGGILAGTFAATDARYQLPSGFLQNGSSGGPTEFLSVPALLAVCAAFAYGRSTWFLAPAAVTAVYVFNALLTGGSGDPVGDFSARMIFQIESRGLSNTLATVFAALVIAWTASRIARAGWHPRQDRMERDGSLNPLFAAIWHDAPRAFGIALFQISVAVAIAVWASQWPLTAPLLAPSK